MAVLHYTNTMAVLDYTNTMAVLHNTNTMAVLNYRSWKYTTHDMGTHLTVLYTKLLSIDLSR